MKLKAFIQNHPTLSFFVLVIAWSYLFWQILFTAMPLDPDKGPTPQHILFAGLGGSPSLFGLLLASYAGGKTGLRNLLSRLSHWRISLRWYAAALLLMPGINVANYLLYKLLGGEPYLPSFTAVVFLGGTMSSILEEFGWRGFALPGLQKRYNGLVSSLIVGLGWGVWHLGLNRTMMGENFSWLNLLVSAWGPPGLTAVSILMTWVYNNGRSSLLLMLLFHFSVTSSFFAFGPPPAYGSAETLRFHLIAIIVLWSIAGILVAFAGAKGLVRSKGLLKPA